MPRSISLRTALLLCALLLAIPMLRLGELVSAQNSARVMANSPIEDDDEVPCVEKAAHPARFAFSAPHSVSVVAPRRTAQHRAVRFCARPESHGDNGCGAVLRC